MERGNRSPKKTNMDPATIAALATAASSLGSQGLNFVASGKMNRKTRKYNEKMYERQRADSIHDYTMQNQYNSPEAQMERLKMAGLNPNLIYKNGATQEAAPVRSSEMPTWRPETPQFDFSGIGGAMGEYMDVQVKKAQVDNLRAANDVAVQDAVLRAAQTASTLQGVESSKFELQKAKDLRAISLETAAEGLRKLKTETHVTLEANERAAAQNAQSLKEGLERILSLQESRAKTQEERAEIRARIKNLGTEGEIKRLELELYKQKIRPQDPIWWRYLGELIDKYKPKLLPNLSK